MSDEKFARKILRSLPKRFDMKATTIEEAQDIATMKVEELIGSLITCEIAINERTDKKVKSIAFVTNADCEETQGDLDTEESIIDALVLLGRQFNKVMKHVDRRQKPDEQNI
ncbi:gag-protease polyprotein [Trifolium repens]|nr:gag-protease polyprotein [Trifolium repens]